MSPADLAASVLRQKVMMHENEGDRLRADIALYEERVVELERNLAASMANAEASLALAEATRADGCHEEGVAQYSPGKPTTDPAPGRRGAEAEAEEAAEEEAGGTAADREGNGDGAGNVSNAGGAPRPRHATLHERAHDGALVSRIVPSASGLPEELDEAKRAAVRASGEALRRTVVTDVMKREHDGFGHFVGYNAKKKSQLPRNYFIDYNESRPDEHPDVRPDGTYKGYGTPGRKAWLTKHTKRILHDFQWVYENNRVHQRQRFLGVRIGQDPFDAFVIQEMLHDVKPDLIIETGTNSGGCALYMAVLMEAINPGCKIFTIDTVEIDEWMKKFKNPSDRARDGDDDLGFVDPRDNVFWKRRVTQAVGKSTDRRILRQLKQDFVSKAKKVLVVLDSDHSSGTVLSELINYAPFVSLGSYILVEDTWQRHPLFAAEKFLEKYGREFVVDRSREHLLWSQHKGGFLKRTTLPPRAESGFDYDYTVDVEVAGGRVKTYSRVDLAAAGASADDAVDAATDAVASSAEAPSKGQPKAKKPASVASR